MLIKYFQIIQPEDWGGDHHVSYFDVLIIIGLVWWLARLHYTGKGTIGSANDKKFSLTEVIRHLFSSQQNKSSYSSPSPRSTNQRKSFSEVKPVIKSEVKIERPRELWEKVLGSPVQNTYARFLMFPPKYLRSYKNSGFPDYKIIRVSKRLIEEELKGKSSFYLSEYDSKETLEYLLVKEISHELKYLQIHAMDVVQGRSLMRGTVFLKTSSDLMPTKQVRIEFEEDCSHWESYFPLEIHLKKALIQKYKDDHNYGLITLNSDNVGFIGSGKHRKATTEELLNSLKL